MNFRSFNIYIVLGFVFTVLAFGCTDNIEEQYPILSKIEHFVPPERTLDDFPLTETDVQSDIHKMIWEKMQKEFLSGKSVYNTRLDQCGDQGVPHTFVDTFIVDVLDNLKKQKLLTVVEKEDVDEDNIFSTLNFMRDNTVLNVNGLRPFEAIKFLDSLKEVDVKNLAFEISNYIDEYGLIEDPWELILAKDDLARDEVVEKYFENQKQGESGAGYFCNYSWTSVVSFFALTNWEIVKEYERADGYMTVRIHSSNKGGIPIIGLYKISFSGFDSTNKCYSDWCIEEISPIE